MPHDKHGRKIDLGDVIIANPYNQKEADGTNALKPREYVGTVMEMTEAQSCTGQMRFFGYDAAFSSEVVVMKDYFGAEDATLVLKHNGKLPEPIKE